MALIRNDRGNGEGAILCISTNLGAIIGLTLSLITVKTNLFGMKFFKHEIFILHPRLIKVIQGFIIYAPGC